MGLHLFYVIAVAISILVSRSPAFRIRRLSRAEFENLNEICGKSFVSNHPRSSVQRVALGSLAKQGEFPWAVYFFKIHSVQPGPSNTLNISASECSGTIISKYHIITAAHCVFINGAYLGSIPFKIENAFVIGGSTCANMTVYSQGNRIPVSTSGEGCTEQVDEDPQALHIKSIIVPRSSRWAQMELPRFGEEVPDIAILELEDPIKYMGDKLLPICVPAINTITAQTFTAYGFGTTDTGKNVKLRKLLAQNCQLTNTNKCGSMWNYEKRCTDSAICYLNNEDGSMCGGDSGGALSGFVAGKEYLFGVISGSSKMNCKYSSAQFQTNLFKATKVTSYIDFLCFYTGVCPLGYDVYSEWNYALNPEAALFFDKEGNYMLPMREVIAEQESPDESYREKE